MKNYRRNRQAGATYFLTLCLNDRRSSLLTDYINELRQAYRKTQLKMPFINEAIVILPDHIHALWTMPDNDDNYPDRVRLFKSYFSRQLPQSVKQTKHSSRIDRKETSIWQRRYWEHTIRDESDFGNHMDYIHYNPVKHGYASNPQDWQYSTLRKLIEESIYPSDWGMDKKLDIISVDYDV